MKTTAQLNNCSLCIIKPHIIQNGQAGMIIDMILNEGFEIAAMEMFYLNKATIEEFYDVYKSVLPEYVPLIEQFISGPCIVLEVRQQNVVNTFREMCGPTDPEIAKYLRPNTIRYLLLFSQLFIEPSSVLIELETQSTALIFQRMEP
jgi:nucleoside-diphosphate kinase